MKLLCNEFTIKYHNLNRCIQKNCCLINFSIFQHKVTMLHIDKSNITMVDSFIYLADNYFNTIYD